MRTWHHVLSPRMGTWFGLAETNRTEGFVCFFSVFLQWKFWSGENCVDASMSGEEPFLDLGKIFLPCSPSSGCLSTSGLPWLQKVFSLWPFVYSGGSCCCSQRGSPSASCTGSEWHLVLSLLGIARSVAVQVSWDVTRFSETPAHTEESSALSRSTACSNIFLLLVAVWGILMLSDFPSCSKLKLLLSFSSP